MAGQAGQLIGAMSIGIGNAAASINDKNLQFEIARIPVALTAYDFVNNKLVFKGSLPEDVEGQIYEVGLWSTEMDSLAGNQGSRIITTFDSTSEVWTPATFDITAVRIGSDSLKHTPAASATSSASMSDLNLDFSGNSSSDKFNFAFNCDNVNTAKVEFTFATDVSNYYKFTINTPANGYNIVQIAKGAATVVGAPNWNDINIVTVATTATGAGLASVSYDGIRIEDIDTINPEYGLIARYIPGAPTKKNAGSVQDFEYTLNVTPT